MYVLHIRTMYTLEGELGAAIYELKEIIILLVVPKITPSINVHSISMDYVMLYPKACNGK